MRSCPGMGVVSELIPAFSRKRPFGYGFIYAMASLAIAILGFLVWAHHMFVAGISIYGGLVFSVLSFLVAIPSAIKVFNWTATLYKGSISLETPMLYALGFIGLFTMGGLTGLFGSPRSASTCTSTTPISVISPFPLHHGRRGAVMARYMGGLHFWWPKITGNPYFPNGWGKNRRHHPLPSDSTSTFFFPQFLLGWFLGMPRLLLCSSAPEFQVYNVMSTAGRVRSWRSRYLLPLGYLLSGRSRSGAKTSSRTTNPFHAAALEW